MYSGKVVLFGKKLLCSGKRGYTRANLVVFVQGGCIWAKWLFSCKVVLFGQGGCNRGKVNVLVQKWLYLPKCCYRAEWLHSVKSCCVQA